MNIQGLNKVTLLDYPGRVACTVFTGGCDLRCPFCHNSQLVLHPTFSPIDEEDVFALLRRRRGIIDGVAITGGEPLLQPDIEAFISRVRELGYSVKLDTNGTHPARLAHLLEAGLVDHVAMDIKNSPERYPETVGIPGFDVTPIRESVALLVGGSTGYEFRTTVVAPLHDEESMLGIGRLIKGAGRYFLQGFADSGALIAPEGLRAVPREEMEKFAAIVAPFVGSAELRGV